jgi:serine/threonine protein kinase
MSTENKPSRDPVNDNRTRIKQPKSKVPDNDSAEFDKNQAALTRIKNTLNVSDNSEGFTKARVAVNKALAENKVVLNKRFVLENVVGNGGMGTVYKARDLRKVEANDLNPYIAVKVLNSDFEHHPDAFVSLQREASRSHILAHPNIVTVHDFDRDGSVIYMTMELLTGEGLDQYLHKNSSTGMEPDAALNVISDCCLALEYAHKHDIIHSDLKPGNIFLTKSGAKVLDFGIARIGASTRNEKDFDAGQLGALTPAYASFEMLQNLPPDPSDDVFALAIISYELLTGIHPYDRLPADVALAKGIRPARIKELSNKQWKALTHALQLKREDRTSTIQNYRDELLTRKNITAYLISGLIVMMAIGWAIYSTQLAPNELSRVIDETLSNANKCYNKKEYICAIDGAEAILKISPEHNEAQNLLKIANVALNKQNIDQILAEANICLQSNDLKCARQKHTLLIKMKPDETVLSLLTHEIDTKQISLTVAQKLNENLACFNQQDWQCVIKTAEEVKALQADNAIADSLINQAKIALEEKKVRAEKIKQKYKNFITRAEQCFNQRDYSCAVKYSKKSLELNKNSSHAESLYQKSIYAQQQQGENRKKADVMLNKGKACFERKNYSCAIAKSESALEIVPNHFGALKLKRDAGRAIADLKRSLVIE